jgi:periplasmic copper chaperone A
MRKYSLWIFVLGLLFITACAGRDAGQSGLEVRDAWARPGQAGGNTAIYFTLVNAQAEDDVLLSAATDAAGVAELHMTNMDSAGTMMMMQQENVPVPAGETVEFAPGGLHVMLIDLNNELLPEQTVTVQLQFERAGTLQVEAPVRQP